MVDHHPPAIFIADVSGLDFLNSIATPAGVAIDWIADGDGLLNWLEQARLVPPDVLTAMRNRATTRELDEVADQARKLREWFRGFVRARMGRPLTADALGALDPLNRLLERDDAFSQLAPHRHGGGTPLELRAMRRWGGPASLLLPIGETLAQFVCRADFTDVKACEGPACTLMFADHTRGRVRKWCSMAFCGNRAKQAAHRHRLRTTPR